MPWHVSRYRNRRFSGPSSINNALTRVRKCGYHCYAALFLRKLWRKYCQAVLNLSIWQTAVRRIHMGIRLPPVCNRGSCSNNSWTVVLLPCRIIYCCLLFPVGLEESPLLWICTYALRHTLCIGYRTVSRTRPFYVSAWAGPFVPFSFLFLFFISGFTVSLPYTFLPFFSYSMLEFVNNYFVQPTFFMNNSAFFWIYE
jgi:hypothetical protein